MHLEVRVRVQDGHSIMARGDLTLVRTWGTKGTGGRKGTRQRAVWASHGSAGPHNRAEKMACGILAQIWYFGG